MSDLVDKYLVEISKADIELLKKRGKVPKDFTGFTTTRGEEGTPVGKALKKEEEQLVKVGDIFYNSWGYDQTNIDWYQVTALTKSGKSVKVRPIAGKIKETGFMSGESSPVKGKFTGPAVAKRVGVNRGEVYLPSKYGWTSKWDGKPKYQSWYA